MRTLYLFIDESGNFDFSPGGTKYFILTVMSTTNPSNIGAGLLELRYNLLPNYACGPAVEEGGHFHATEDKQAVRNQVFSVLVSEDNDIRIDAVIAQKNRANPIFYKQESKFYQQMGEPALKYAFNRAIWEDYEHVVIVFSSLFDKKKRGNLKQAFKSLIKYYAGVPFSLYFHNSKFDLCSQAVDYFGWAIYRRWESEENRSYNIIRHLIKSEFSIFERGLREFY
jgi:hypothetical protein